MSRVGENMHSTVNFSSQQETIQHVQLLKLSECDLHHRQIIEHALADPYARIPQQFHQSFYDYLYRHTHQQLRQVNFLAQIAFLLYFFVDLFVIPDLSILSGFVRVGVISAAFLVCYILFKQSKDIRILDMILPIGTAVCVSVWIGLLLLSNSPHVSNYLYASAIFILITNLCVRTQFKPALYCSIFIGAIVSFAAIKIMSLFEAFIFAVILTPIWIFSIYINWNNTLNARLNFLRTLLDEWNYHTVTKLAHTDELTQLYNRRHFVNLAEYSIHKWPKHASSCLLMFDVDHFKRINDNYGHDVGDRVLQVIAETTRKEMRHSDVLARFGGEEFTVLLSDTQLQDAHMIAERIRHSIEQQYLYVRPNQALHFTISIGIAELESHTQDLNDLIKKADIALYEAKARGRNCIIIYSQEMSPKSEAQQKKSMSSKIVNKGSTQYSTNHNEFGSIL